MGYKISAHGIQSIHPNNKEIERITKEVLNSTHAPNDQGNNKILLSV